MEKQLVCTPSEINASQPVPRGEAAREIVMMPASFSHEPDASTTWSELADMLGRRRGRIALVVALGLALGQGVNLVQTPVYRSEASVEVQGLNENYLNLAQVDPSAPLSPQTMDSYIQTQVEILQSPALIERVADKMKLQQQQEFTPGTTWFDAVAKAAHLPVAPALPAGVYAAQKASDRLRVQQIRQSRLIRVSFDSANPKLAAGFVNDLLDEYQKQNLEARWQTNTQTRELLDAQLADLKTRLESSEYAMQSYARQNGLMFTTGTGGRESVAEDRLRQIQTELSQAQADRISKQSQFDTALTSSADSLPPTVDTSALRAYQAKLTDLKREMAQLSTLYQPENFKVQQVRAQVEQVQAAIATEVTDIRSRVRKDYESAVYRERQLGAAYTQQARLITDQSAKSVRYNILLREVESNRALYDGMLQKVKDARIAAAIRSSNVRAIAAAEPPAAPYRPNVPLNLAVGLFVGLSAALGTVLMQRRSNLPVRAPGEMFTLMNVPELGAIPRVARGSINGRGTPLISGGRPGQVELITLERKLSEVSESFRNILASIVLPGPTTTPRVLVVTSARAMEGKTTVTSNLAIALAESGRRVLVVDADTRSPRMQSVFNVPNTWGLSDLLRDEKAIADLPESVLVKSTQIERLSLLPSGPPSKEFHRLLHSTAMPALLNRLRETYDHIIIDAPPLLYFADARMLGHYADGVVLVVRANQTSRNTVATAIERLHADGIPLFGAILNDWDPQVRGEAYGYQDLHKYSKHYDRSIS